MALSASENNLGENERCFFGKISADEAAQVLQKDCLAREGSWLIRESISSEGDFVLSIIIDGQPQHILIHRHSPDDSVFSLTLHENCPAFHGLDSLILHYKSHSLQPLTFAATEIQFDSVSSQVLPANKVPYTLQKSCQGDFLPPSTRLHGSSNLLHRAVTQENLTVVRELLQSGYRKFDARNKEGLSALHLACLTGDEEIVAELLRAGATVKVRDSDGLTALHYACRTHRHSLLALLIDHNPSAVQLRAPLTAEVPLHEAAASQSLSCVQILLGRGAPSRPRNCLGQTPQDLARDQGATAIVSFLNNHRPPKPRFRQGAFLHGSMTRERCQEILLKAEREALGRLQEAGYVIASKATNNLHCDLNVLSPSDVIDKTAHELSKVAINVEEDMNELASAVTVFLVRSSERSGRYVLSLRHAQQTLHFEILTEKDSSVYIDDGPLFPSLETLVDHYCRFDDGLPSILTTPVSVYGCLHQAASPRDRGHNVDPSVLSSNIPSRTVCFTFKNSSSDVGTESSVEASHHDAALENSWTSELLSSESALKHSNYVPLCSPCLDGNKTLEVFGVIDQSNLQVGNALGVGEFGSVLRGVWSSPAGDQMHVAIKKMHSSNSIESRNQFLQEAKLMMNLNHPYIIKLLGVCYGPPISMVQELAPMGSLLDFLLDYQKDINPRFHLRLWPAQVALGMQYLEDSRFVHRDLACRNLLLSSITLVKITDFGLSRAIGNNDYYRATQGGKWPLKWYAPEAINYGRFTHSSDVWSYGVTLWEMYTYGDQPYGECSGHKVVQLLEKGERLPCPENCSENVYKVMQNCWNLEPAARPSFKQLASHFTNGSEYVDIKPFLKIK